MTAWCGGEQKYWGHCLTLHLGLGLLRDASQVPLIGTVRRAASPISRPSMRPNCERGTVSLRASTLCTLVSEARVFDRWGCDPQSVIETPAARGATPAMAPLLIYSTHDHRRASYESASLLSLYSPLLCQTDVSTATCITFDTAGYSFGYRFRSCAPF